MFSINKVILIGRPTRDPEVRYSQGQNSLAIARFTLAVNRRLKNNNEQQSADFINCISFGKQAEFIEKYIKQGIKLIVEGRIQTGNYTNKEGQKVYTTEVVIEKMEFAESKSKDGQDTRPESNPASDEGFMNIPDGIDEELPFN